MITRAVKLALLLLFAAHFSAFAINNFTINGSEETVVSLTGQNVRLAGNLDSPGSTLNCYFYLDANENRTIDKNDPLIKFIAIKDGVGWIREPEIVAGSIPGDENFLAGRFQTTLRTCELLPPSSQTWIIKVYEGKSSASALLHWRIDSKHSNLTGTLRGFDNFSGSVVIYALKEGATHRQKLALVGNAGPFALRLNPGDWIIFAEALGNPSLQTDFYDLTIKADEHQKIELKVQEPLDTRVPDIAPVRLLQSSLIEDGPVFGETAIDLQLATANNSVREDNFSGSILPAAPSLLSQQDSRSTITGKVYVDDETPAQGITVVAVNEQEKEPAGTIFTQTDQQGAFRLTTTIPGEWKIGVHSNLYSANPAIQFLYLSGGEQYSGLEYHLTISEGAGHYLSERSRLDLELDYGSSDIALPVFQLRLPVESLTKMEILDIDGNNIRTLINTIISTGEKIVPWDGKDKNGIEISSGVYVCRIETERESLTKTFALLK